MEARQKALEQSAAGIKVQNIYINKKPWGMDGLLHISLFSEENPSESTHTIAHDELRKIAQILKNLGTIYYWIKRCFVFIAN